MPQILHCAETQQPAYSQNHKGYNPNNKAYNLNDKAYNFCAEAYNLDAEAYGARFEARQSFKAAITMQANRHSTIACYFHSSKLFKRMLCNSNRQHFRRFLQLQRHH